MADFVAEIVDSTNGVTETHKEIVSLAGGGDMLSSANLSDVADILTALQNLMAEVTGTPDGTKVLQDDLSWVAQSGGGGGGGGDITLIAETLLTGNAASISFSNISNSYKDLLIVGRFRTDRSSNTVDAIGIQVGNGSVDSGTNYAYKTWARAGDGTSADSDSTAASSLRPCGSVTPGATATAGVFGVMQCSILGYSNTGYPRMFQGEGGVVQSTTAATKSGFGSGHWTNTSSVIDVVTLISVTGSNFIAGTEVRLYGIGSLAGGSGSMGSQDFIKRSTGTNLSIGATAITELATATNGPGTTGFDIVLPASVGDVIAYDINGMWGNQSVVSTLDVYTIVSGSRVNAFGAGLSASVGSTAGVTSWQGMSGAYDRIQGTVFLTVQSGDISSGTVTLRPYYAGTSGTARTIYSDANNVLYFAAINRGAAS